MIARNLQELADAVNVMEQRLVHSGLHEMGYTPRLFRMAAAFSADLLLASSDDRVTALIRAHPKRAGAFLSVLAQVREELEAAGFEISAVPDVPFLLYAPAADAVSEAARAYQRRQPFLSPLRAAPPQTSGGGR